MPEELDDPCPCEKRFPAEGINPVGDEERLIKIVTIREQVVVSPGGRIALSSAAIREDDIAGRKERSVSTFRGDLMAPTELERRAKALNKVPEWGDDPLSAIAQTAVLRAIIDSSGRREVCVNAQPTGQEDKLGPCTTHAGILRSKAKPLPISSENFKTKVQDTRLSWLAVRLNVAEKFVEFKHVCSKIDATDQTIK